MQQWAVLFCQPITDRLCANYIGYWLRYRVWLAALRLTAVLDYLSTVHFMHEDGIHFELHPLVRYSALLAGPVIGVGLAKLFQRAATFLVTLYCKVLARYIFFSTTVFYGWAAWYNVWGCDIYRPWALQFMPPWW